MLTFEGYNKLPGKKKGVHDVPLPFEVANGGKSRIIALCGFLLLISATIKCHDSRPLPVDFATKIADTVVADYCNSEKLDRGSVVPVPSGKVCRCKTATCAEKDCFDGPSRYYNNSIQGWELYFRYLKNPEHRLSVVVYNDGSVRLDSDRLSDDFYLNLRANQAKYRSMVTGQ